MKQNTVPVDATALAELLRELRLVRRNLKSAPELKGRARQSLPASERKAILSKTGAKCHICGGAIDGDNWHADHVMPHSGGGPHVSDNYLAAHALCNNYRWNYTPAEFQQILKLGVWLRTQVERKTPLGLSAAKSFLAYERARVARRRQAVA